MRSAIIRKNISTMEINVKFDHFNINVSDMERSLEFYKKALDLEECGEIIGPDGVFVIKYLKAREGDFRLELTWLKEHPQGYDLGENEFHIALRAHSDYERLHEYHRRLGCICFENERMGIYFINDPDDYWIEIIPPLKG